MNTNPRSFWCLCLLVMPILGLSQSSYQFGALPSVTFNKKLPKDYVLNFKTESRQEFQSGAFNGERSGGYDYLLTDFTFLGGKKVGLNSTINLGYLFRVENGMIIHRSIQQFISVKKYNGFKLAQRLATDQTFEKDTPIAFRLRYRLATEIPLSGLEVDSKEFYLKVNTEFLNEMQDGSYDAEFRFVPFVGYALSNSQKLEIGIDYRLDSFINQSPEHTFWLGVNWYKSI